MDAMDYDVIIIGGGIAGLATAYETLCAAQEANRSMRLAVITDKINSPSAHGSQVVFGVDGFSSEGAHPQQKTISNLIRNGIGRIAHIIKDHNIWTCYFAKFSRWSCHCSLVGTWR